MLGEDEMNEYFEKCPDENVKSIASSMLERAKKGLEKYGVTTERKDLSVTEWLQHAMEESMDFCVYLKKLQTEVLDKEELIQEFHEAFCHPVDATATIDILKLRERLILEEAKEVSEAITEITQEMYYGSEGTHEQWVHLLKELTDLQVVLSGTIVALKKFSKESFNEAFRLTHESNMSKLDDKGQPIIDGGGKILKGPNYKKPDLNHLVD